MLTLPAKKIAVVPIFDADEIRKVGALSAAELAYLKEHENEGWAQNANEASLIVVPEQAKERCDQGIVKYVGSKVTSVKPGDYVFFSGYTGSLIQIEGEGLMIFMLERFVEAKWEIDKPALTVPGLWFKSSYKDTLDGLSVGGSYYTPATYEQAIELLTRAITEAYEPVNIKSKEPHPDDIVEDEDV